MAKRDRLSHIIQVYLEGDLELDTAVAELVHVYVERGWRFSLVEADCAPQFRERMRALAIRVDAAILEHKSRGGEPRFPPPIVIR